MPVCTPSRAQLMTGRYAMRYGLQTLVIFPSHTYGLATDERTLPQALKEAGYKTLMVGKWHLGHADRKYWPQNRGFDYFYGNVVGEVDYFTRERGGLIDWQRNGVFLKEQGYYTDLIGNDAVRLIDQQDGKQPFFLYFASLALARALSGAAGRDRPIQVRRRSAAADLFGDDHGARRSGRPHRRRTRQEGPARQHHHPVRQRQRRRDQRAVRQGAKSNEERGSEEGGVQQNQKTPASNAPFSGGKGSLREGGVRVPAFVNWPGKLKPRRRHRAARHGRRDADAAGAGRRQGQPRPSVRRQGHVGDDRRRRASPHDDILINVEAFRGAVRKGDWKLIKIALLPGKTQLFNLAKDPSETTDVAAENPEIVKDLEARLLAYAKEQKPSLWIKAQPAFVGNQGKTVMDPDFDIDDSGLPHERMALGEVMASALDGDYW